MTMQYIIKTFLKNDCGLFVVDDPDRLIRKQQMLRLHVHDMYEHCGRLARG